ncbi:MAG: acriflavin resistance protein [Legionellales bacterium]|nr:acriflavin resistance protein [Legionellales bacterium]
MSLKKNNFITLFARHPVAANLLMLSMILTGLWALTQMNTQFLPTFSVNIITVSVEWPGASAEDVERSIVRPMETELRNVDYLKDMSSSSRIGQAKITLEFIQNSDMSAALEQVKEKIAQVRNLPDNAEEPIIKKQENFEEIAKVVFSGTQNIHELRPYIRKIEQDLLDRGIAKIEIVGLPDDEIAIQVPARNLAKLNMSLNDIANKVREESQDIPTGAIGKNSVSKQLRSLQQRRTIAGFQTVPIKTDDQGQLITIGDIAYVEKRAKEYQVQVQHLDNPAIELILYRTENSDSLKAAKVLQQWYKQIKPQLPKNMHVKIYNESWQLIKERIVLLLKNGAGGFILILILLFLFLNNRVAFWVAMGIPVSFLAAIFVLYVMGGSINMVSLFAIIMTLGIIVDDTIVVGEESLTLLQRGYLVKEAVELGAQRMLAPIFSSSLTTIAAFLPLLLIGDIIGTILKAIPMVVIAVIIASVIECFLVLPGHLRHSFRNIRTLHNETTHSYVSKKFEKFKEYHFKRFVTYAIEHRLITISVTIAFLFLGIGLIVGGRVNFNFFPSPDSTIISADVQFHAGTPENEIKNYMQTLSIALNKTNRQLQKDKSLVKTSVTYIYRGSEEKGNAPEYASMTVELVDPDARNITNKQFMEKWRSLTPVSTWIDHLIIAAPRAGPPGQDIDIQLSSDNVLTLKQAAESLKRELKKYHGVSNIMDDLPYGQEQLIFALKPQGKALGLTVDNIGRQISGAFTGALAQVYHEPNEEIEVRITLPQTERQNFKILEQFPIITPNGSVVPLYNIASFNSQRGFDVLNHTDTKLTTHVTAEVDATETNSNKILADLSSNQLQTLAKKYNVKYSLEGRAQEQRDTLSDMRYGMILAFMLIYIILAWVFSSYIWPLIVMSVIPLGLVGAIIGHWVMGHDLTILSLFGFFGLSGIVINDSIILIVRYKELRKKHEHAHDAIIEASCQRLRAVLLTSLTTIAGLTPLMFERSLQAQFLIPMAISITFGLAFATLLILVLIPTLLSMLVSQKF